MSWRSANVCRCSDGIRLLYHLRQKGSKYKFYPRAVSVTVGSAHHSAKIQQDNWVLKRGGVSQRASAANSSQSRRRRITTLPSSRSPPFSPKCSFDEGAKIIRPTYATHEWVYSIAIPRALKSEPSARSSRMRLDTLKVSCSASKFCNLYFSFDPHFGFLTTPTRRAKLRISCYAVASRSN